ncbi:MAG: hypothetical protein WA862_03485, partial [Solirubrobacterales bacterium]
KSSPLSLRRTSANAGGVALKVATNGPGRLRAQGKGLKPASRTVKAAATYTLKLSLRAGARRTLAERGKLRVRVRVRFEPDQGKTTSKTVKLTVKTNRKGN